MFTESTIWELNNEFMVFISAIDKISRDKP
jgi:hypothetical protein